MQDTPHTRLTVETAANRVILRALLAHLVVSDPVNAAKTVRSIQRAIQKMAAGAIHDMDPTVRAKAIALVEKRAQAFLTEFALDATAT